MMFLVVKYIFVDKLDNGDIQIVTQNIDRSNYCTVTVPQWPH